MKNHHDVPNAIANLEIRSRLASSDAFFSQLLHDLKQSLNLIRFIAQDVRLDIRKNRLDVTLLPESMKEVESSIDTMVYRLDKLRLFVESKNTEDTIEQVNPNQLCMAAIRRIGSAKSNVRVIESYINDPPTISTNVFFFIQAISEILDNARYAATRVNSTDPRLEAVSSIRGEHFVLNIQDNGPGVDNEIREKIFEPFVTTRPDAAGLGLPLSRALISKCSGTVQLVDSDSSGTVFEISVPYEIIP